MYTLGVQLYWLLSILLFAGCGVAVYRIVQDRLREKADPDQEEEDP